MISTTLWRRVAPVAALASVLAAPIRAEHQGHFDPAPAWPLCGRITEDPPADWVFGSPCPAGRFGNPDHHDGPLSSTYGPRQLVSENYRYDFHRGLDIATAVGTPVFAFADGVVRKAGEDPAYSDPLVQLRHYRPGHWGACGDGGGCYTTNYLHMSEAVVEVDATVSKGDLIGYSGQSASGFAHVHLELRDAPAQDPFSAWQRDTINPLAALPYVESGTANTTLTLDTVDTSDPLNPQVYVTAALPNSVELDLERVEVELFEIQPDSTLVAIPQPGNIPVGTTVEGVGYAVEPPWWSMHIWNRQYSYKDSSAVPWESFLNGGQYESPYWVELPSSYDPNVHLDRADPNDYQVGLFNGVSVTPIHYNATEPEWRVTLGFHALTGVPDADDLEVRVRALDVHGNATPWVHYRLAVVDKNDPLPVPQVQTVPLDILPWRCENRLARRGLRTLPAAIIASDVHDPAALDPASLRLAGVAPSWWRLWDIGAPATDGDGCTERGHDGRPDLLALFDARAVIAAHEFALGRSLGPGEEATLELEGLRLDGSPVIGSDVIVVTPWRRRR